jgi:hypothetical protein
MKLIELEGRFLKFTGDQKQHKWQNVDQIDEADAVMFLCPLCFRHNKGPINTHSVICIRFARVPDWVKPQPGRWIFNGTSLNDLTFSPPPGKTPSVQLIGGNCAGNRPPWHGFVTNGDAS